MVRWLWLVPATPVAGFVALVIAGRRSGRVAIAILGTVPVAVSTAVACLVGARLIASPVETRSFTQTLWTWARIGEFAPTIGFRIDPLSLVMMLVVTGVS